MSTLAWSPIAAERTKWATIDGRAYTNATSLSHLPRSLMRPRVLAATRPLAASRVAQSPVVAPEAAADMAAAAEEVARTVGAAAEMAAPTMTANLVVPMVPPRRSAACQTDRNSCSINHYMVGFITTADLVDHLDCLQRSF